MLPVAPRQRARAQDGADPGRAAAGSEEMPAGWAFRGVRTARYTYAWYPNTGFDGALRPAPRPRRSCATWPTTRSTRASRRSCGAGPLLLARCSGEQCNVTFGPLDASGGASRRTVGAQELGTQETLMRHRQPCSPPASSPSSSPACSTAAPTGAATRHRPARSGCPRRTKYGRDSRPRSRTTSASSTTADAQAPTTACRSTPSGTRNRMARTRDHGPPATWSRSARLRARAVSENIADGYPNRPRRRPRGWMQLDRGSPGEHPEPELPADGRRGPQGRQRRAGTPPRCSARQLLIGFVGVWPAP